MRRSYVKPSGEESLEGTHGLALGLPLADPARDIGLRLRRMAQMGAGDPLEDGVEPPVPAAVQTMAYPARRGDF